MPTTTEVFTNELNFTKPFLLFLGRKTTLINRPSRLEIKRTHLVSKPDGDYDQPFISPHPVRQSMKLFIDDQLYCAIFPGVKRNSLRIKRQPEGLTEVHLVKKHTTLALKT